uniref:DDE_Tnp_1_7 domain-containing protein n=1 Tax=Steinernema glaseri TaxID=37863 RepID=A0A1I8A8A2_9BILA
MVVQCIYLLIKHNGSTCAGIDSVLRPKKDYNQQRFARDERAKHKIELWHPLNKFIEIYIDNVAKMQPVEYHFHRPLALIETFKSIMHLNALTMHLFSKAINVSSSVCE